MFVTFFYILIVFRFDIFKFYSYLEWISTKDFPVLQDV